MFDLSLSVLQSSPCPLAMRCFSSSLLSPSDFPAIPKPESPVWAPSSAPTCPQGPSVSSLGPFSASCLAFQDSTQVSFSPFHTGPQNNQKVHLVMLRSLAGTFEHFELHQQQQQGLYAVPSPSRPQNFVTVNYLYHSLILLWLLDCQVFQVRVYILFMGSFLKL